MLISVVKAISIAVFFMAATAFAADLGVEYRLERTLSEKALESRGAIIAIEGDGAAEVANRDAQNLYRLVTIDKSWNANTAQLGSLGQVPNVVYLKLRNIEFDFPAEVLSELSEIRYLILDNTSPSKGLLDVLPSLPKLEYVSLRGCEITNSDLVALERCSHLLALTLDGTSLEDAGLIHIGKIQSLEFLHLQHTAITDDGLKHLISLPSLRSIWVRGAGTTPSGARIALQALPNLVVVDETTTERVLHRPREAVGLQWILADEESRQRTNARIANGLSVNASFSGGRTLLHNYAGSGMIRTVDLLLSLGADPHLMDDETNTSLHKAALNGHASTARRLLLTGADVNAVAAKKKDVTPLHLAVLSEGYDVVALLLEFGADIDSKNTDGVTPLIWAAREGKEDVVQLLVDKGADTNVSSTVNGLAGLHWAAKNGHDRCAQVLLDGGAKVDQRDHLRLTPLLWAATKNQPAAARILIEANADVNASCGPVGATVLHLAATHGNSELVRLLLANGGNYKQTNALFQTPEDLAEANGHEAVALLLKDAVKQGQE